MRSGGGIKQKTNCFRADSISFRGFSPSGATTKTHYVLVPSVLFDLIDLPVEQDAPAVPPPPRASTRRRGRCYDARMFESAEIGSRVDKETYAAEEPKLRS